MTLGKNSQVGFRGILYVHVVYVMKRD